MNRAVPLSTILVAALAFVACALLGLFAFRLQNRAALAEQNATLADAEIKALQQDLEIERLVAERLAGDTVDLGQVRAALLSPADATSAPAFVVIWSPASGDGVLLRLTDVPLPVDARFQLTATRSPSSDRLESDLIVDAAAPTAFRRGLFTYRSERPAEVSAFSLRVTAASAPDKILRFGGTLRP